MPVAPRRRAGTGSRSKPEQLAAINRRRDRPRLGTCARGDAHDARRVSLMPGPQQSNQQRCAINHRANTSYCNETRLGDGLRTHWSTPWKEIEQAMARSHRITPHGKVCPRHGRKRDPVAASEVGGRLNQFLESATL